jgi:glutathione synthase/RimK-type ligase-like ATP-grasp enzyme
VAREDLSFGARFFRSAAEKRGWTIALHPDGAFAGEIVLPGGTRRFFVRSTYDLNSAAAALVARDKELTKFFLARGGFPVLPGRTFFAARVERSFGRDAAAAFAYAKEIGFPVMVKANSGAAGRGVECVRRADDFPEALDRVFAVDDVALIEPYVAGMRDYRVLVLDGEVLLAYERRPFSVTGDGASTLRGLVEQAMELARARGAGAPDAVALPEEEESRVVPAGQEVRILAVANLSQGGSAVELEPDRETARLAIDAARAMNLRFCGVDLLVDESSRWILELNASPTFHHFATLCAVSDERLAAIYDRILLAMVRS